MFASVLTRRRRPGGRKGPGDQPRQIRRGFARAASPAAAAGIALTAAGLTGAGAPALAATQSPGPPAYTNWAAGYQAQGRWFRFVAATLTVPPRTLPSPNGELNDAAELMLGNATVVAVLTVAPGCGGSPVAA